MGWELQMKKTLIAVFVTIMISVLAFTVSATYADSNKTVIVYGVDSIVYGSHVNLKAYSGNTTEVLSISLIDRENIEYNIKDMSKEVVDEFVESINGVYTCYDNYYLFELDYGMDWDYLNDFTVVDNGRIVVDPENGFVGIPNNGDSKLENTVRIDDETQIFLINSKNEIIKCEFDIEKEFFLDGIKDSAMFYADKIGFDEGATYRSNYGIADLVVIKNVVSPKLSMNSVSNWYHAEIAYVPNDIGVGTTGTPEDFGISAIMANGSDIYTKFTSSGDIFYLSNHKNVEKLYVPGEVDVLKKGLYSVDTRGFVYDYKSFDDLVLGTNAFKLNGLHDQRVYMKKLKLSDIDYYGYNNIVVNGFSNDSAGVKAIVLKAFECDEYGNISVVTKANKKLLRYFENIDGEVPVIVSGNKRGILDMDYKYDVNALCLAIPGLIKDGKYRYSVIYDANGGTKAPDNDMANGEYTVPLSSPERSGYMFLGWSLTKGGSAVYECGDKIDVDNNIKLYAVWKEFVPVKGDADNSGSVDAMDSVKLYRFVSGWNGYELDDYEKLNSDLNGDGKVDLIDAIYLERHLALWYKYKDFTV